VFCLGFDNNHRTRSVSDDIRTGRAEERRESIFSMSSNQDVIGSKSLGLFNDLILWRFPWLIEGHMIDSIFFGYFNKFLHGVLSQFFSLSLFFLDCAVPQVWTCKMTSWSFFLSINRRAWYIASLAVNDESTATIQTCPSAPKPFHSYGGL